MRLSFSLCLFTLLSIHHPTDGFVLPLQNGQTFFANKQSVLLQEKIDPNEAAKSMSSAALDQMKNLKPEDIDRVLKDIDNMNPLQKNALKALNMDPDVMKKRMQIMRDNPALVENAKKLMANMNPDELMEQAKKSQEKLNDMTPEERDKFMNAVPNKEQLDAAVQMMESQQSTSTASGEDVPVVTGPGSSSDSQVIDAMFRVAEYMSESPTDGGVTFTGFYSLPVIQLLLGDREADLSMSELQECWADGSLGSTRIDRAGFERVWNEVQEYFEQDIMTESRKEAKKKTPKEEIGDTSKSTVVTEKIGENLNQKQIEELNDRVKNLSTSNVLDMMEDMNPAQEARVKSMGIDPKLMQQTAALLRENPQMREQAQKMMQNMSPEVMLKTSQQAQEQIANMSEDDVDEVLNQLKNPPKD